MRMLQDGKSMIGSEVRFWLNNACSLKRGNNVIN